MVPLIPVSVDAMDAADEVDDEAVPAPPHWCRRVHHALPKEIVR